MKFVWVLSCLIAFTSSSASAEADVPIGKAKIGRMPASQDFYPAESKAAGHQGSSTVRVCVNPEGQLESSEIVVSSGHDELDKAAIRLAREGRYEPEKVDGNAVNSCASFRVNFSISDSGTRTGAPQTIAELRRAAEAGSGSAQVNLGVRYARGDGVEQDDVEAFKWFSAAADQGIATGQLNVGVSFHNGKGVKKDPRKAEKFYLLAAGQGSATAEKYLGYLYKDGELGKRNPEEAARWLKKSAERKDRDAAYSLGWLYFRGGILAQKTPDAYYWFLIAEKLGHPDAESLRLRAAQVTSPADINEAKINVERFLADPTQLGSLREKSKTKGVNEKTARLEENPAPDSSEFLISADNEIVRISSPDLVLSVPSPEGLAPLIGVLTDASNDLKIIRTNFQQEMRAQNMIGVNFLLQREIANSILGEEFDRLTACSALTPIGREISTSEFSMLKSELKSRIDEGELSTIIGPLVEKYLAKSRFTKSELDEISKALKTSKIVARATSIDRLDENYFVYSYELGVSDAAATDKWKSAPIVYRTFGLAHVSQRALFMECMTADESRGRRWTKRVTLDWVTRISNLKPKREQ
jgi:TonB family protein